MLACGCAVASVRDGLSPSQPQRKTLGSVSSPDLEAVSRFALPAFTDLRVLRLGRAREMLGEQIASLAHCLRRPQKTHLLGLRILANFPLTMIIHYSNKHHGLQKMLRLRKRNSVTVEFFGERGKSHVWGEVLPHE